LGIVAAGIVIGSWGMRKFAGKFGESRRFGSVDATFELILNKLTSVFICSSSSAARVGIVSRLKRCSAIVKPADRIKVD
jgi:hypothetical protein